MHLAAMLSILPVLLLSEATPGRAQAVPLVEDSFQAACETLKTELAKVNQRDTPDRYWFCEEANGQDRFIVTMALRSSEPNPDGTFPPSNLIGWYAVARRSPIAFEFDINEDRLLPLRPFSVAR